MAQVQSPQAQDGQQEAVSHAAWVRQGAAAQGVALVVMALAICLSLWLRSSVALHAGHRWPETLPVTLTAIATLAVFHWCWPLRSGKSGRVISGISAVLALTASWCANAMPDVLQLRNTLCWISPIEGWFAVAGSLMVVLMVASFAAQMARVERTHLIRALSHTVTGGMASVMMTGWCFAPQLIVLVGRGVTATDLSEQIVTWVVVAIVVAAAPGLFLSCRAWLREADPAPGSTMPWLGISLLPMMIWGGVIAAACLVLSVL